jgi:hypothetical protein
MLRESTGHLFDEPEDGLTEPAPRPGAELAEVPLAKRMRPRTLDEFVGQATDSPAYQGRYSAPPSGDDPDPREQRGGRR